MRAILDEDDTLLGQVYRHDLAGLTPAQMAEAEGNEGVGFVYTYRTQIRALVEGEIPTSPTIAQQAARRVRKWLKTIAMSAELKADLEDLESKLTSRAEDVSAQSKEIESAVTATAKAEAVGAPGIYVYTLPHYLKHPVDPDTGKTLLKVGHSARDAYYRAGSAGRLTALPEDPILLRIYPVEESAAREKDFHGWLRDADHNAGRTKRGGSEWFVTSTKFLDRVAKSLGLEIRVVNDFEAGED
ncbi:hypothetical protein ISU07_17905 [Nocardioides islandensis]|uniref:GIY-YIG nuclease family protein n=1 Tax=Nocardioides islandensis TaxID=433663 RepID=A0A930VJG9_9ACTN|nr:hypothetical protein [Nocardioides islandensis]MBF4765010.1 hypothetical protein [Nocardioides islandensis]